MRGQDLIPMPEGDAVVSNKRDLSSMDADQEPPGKDTRRDRLLACHSSANQQGMRFIQLVRHQL